MSFQSSLSSLELLTKISKYISQTVDLTKVLPNIIDEVKSYLQCEQVFICYFNPEGDEEIITGTIAQNNTKNFKEVIKTYLSEEDTLIELQQNQENSENNLIKNPTTKPVFKSELILPITLKTPEIISAENETLWGLFFAYDYNKSRIWKEQEIQTTKQIIEQIVLGIERQIIYDELQLQIKRRKEEAIIDDLTQLPNYQSFLDCLEFEWHRLARERKSVSLITINVNLSPNDSEELILPTIASSLLETVKRSCDLVARCSDSQFAIILPETDSKGANYVANKIYDLLQKNLIDFNNLIINLGVVTAIPQPKSNCSIIKEAATNCLEEAINKKISINVTEIN